MDRKRGYAYDPIGNRNTSSTWGGEPAAENVTTYTANNVNQYTATANPAESFTYDFDGNLTSDGERSYAWDDENRLFWVAPKTPTTGDVAWYYEYDYLGRRVRKYSYLWDPALNGGYGGWPVAPTIFQDDQRFVYDDWNMVMELDGRDLTGGSGGIPDGQPDNAPLRKYTWGLDLSGSMHGAGGVGGLLSISDANATPTNSTDDLNYMYLYDANGNVGQLIDWQDSLGDAAPTLVAKYEYDANGTSLLDPANASASGMYAEANPFRFSTKYCEGDLDNSATSDDLYYYGYRYYRPDIGRWTNRDPIEERGSWNLFAFSANSPIVYVDPNGDTPFGNVPILFDSLQLWCAPSGIGGTLGGNHCTILCNGITIDGTGPLSPSGGNPDGHGDPGIEFGNQLNPSAVLEVDIPAPFGMCHCLQQKGKALNALAGKRYGITKSNSNSALNCIVKACSMVIRPQQGGSGTGWDTPIDYNCSYQPNYPADVVPGCTVCDTVNCSKL